MYIVFLNFVTEKSIQIQAQSMYTLITFVSHPLVQCSSVQSPALLHLQGHTTNVATGQMHSQARIHIIPSQTLLRNKVMGHHWYYMYIHVACYDCCTLNSVLTLTFSIRSKCNRPYSVRVATVITLLHMAT